MFFTCAYKGSWIKVSRACDTHCFVAKKCRRHKKISLFKPWPINCKFYARLPAMNSISLQELRRKSLHFSTLDYSFVPWKSHKSVSPDSHYTYSLVPAFLAYQKVRQVYGKPFLGFFRDSHLAQENRLLMQWLLLTKVVSNIQNWVQSSVHLCFKRNVIKTLQTTCCPTL